MKIKFLLISVLSVLSFQGYAQSDQSDQSDQSVLLFENSDFEKGNLENWTAKGDAFQKMQPVKGDNTKVRGKEPSNLQGNFWIGTYENYDGKTGKPGDIRGDKDAGSLTSIPFVVKQNYISFRIGGGSDWRRLGVRLVCDGKEKMLATGSNRETMETFSSDVRDFKGKTVQLKVVDAHGGNWGHINVDDFRASNKVVGRLAVKPVNKNDWPKEVEKIRYTVTSDKSKQWMLMSTAKSKKKRPLLVGLHTWSCSYATGGGDAVYARWCIDKDWHFVHPNFRGANTRPQAMGSEMSVQDIIDTVEYMKKNYNVDEDRIYLIGVSGGGYSSILMAGRAPDIWAGVSAWVPISDIHAWWKHHVKIKDGKVEKGRYAKHIEQSAGGDPSKDKKVAAECVKRSANTYLHNAKNVNLDINAGITDGHSGGSVPFSHSLYAFNRVADKKDIINPETIEKFFEKQTLPENLKKAESDPLYGKKEVIFRKTSNNVRVSIFKGKHEIIHLAALNWLAAQRKGKPAVWKLDKTYAIETKDNEADSGL